ncbi:OmpA/MotB family protein [Desulfosoma caldarium]|uniref:Chemotaxis protein MotB n=1 Tax=Desulfosoma caldarium TaxID=610254 RepID=A0A3N1VIP1_9BACT|nr:flagellar motor protein MotB [Desulfosoma caldarium]ROR01899.1 chemotaxis protein MotB [Desulfosoma caldarium]
MPNSKSSRKNKSGGDEGPAAEGWLTTYCDLCTLLLTFFVLLLSMSVLDNIRQKQALNSLVGAFGFLPGGRTAIGKPTGMDISEFEAPMETKALDFDVLREVTMKNELDKEVEIIKKDETLTIVLHQKILFEPGSFDLKPAARTYLSQLVPYLAKDSREIEIGGHTDRFEKIEDPSWEKSSWMISTKRAMAVYRFLLSQGLEPKRVSAHGFSYEKPLVDGIQYPHLRHRNSRVEIVLTYSRHLPASLLHEDPTPSPYFNYKNFFFRLFPMPEKSSQPQNRPPTVATQKTKERG